MSGCASVNQSHEFSDLSVKTVSGLNAKIDADATKSVTGKATLKILFGFITLEGANKFADGYGSGFGTLAKAKSAAAYNAIQTCKCDVIVSPQYIVEKNNWFVGSTTTVTVKGFAGKINSFEQVAPGKISIGGGSSGSDRQKLFGIF